MRSGNHNQEKQLKSLANHLQEKHVAKVASQAGDAAGFGSGACDIWVDSGNAVTEENQSRGWHHEQWIIQSFVILGHEKHMNTEHWLFQEAWPLNT